MWFELDAEIEPRLRDPGDSGDNRERRGQGVERGRPGRQRRGCCGHTARESTWTEGRAGPQRAVDTQSRGPGGQAAGLTGAPTAGVTPWGLEPRRRGGVTTVPCGGELWRTGDTTQLSFGAGLSGPRGCSGHHNGPMAGRRNQRQPVKTAGPWTWAPLGEVAGALLEMGCLLCPAPCHRLLVSSSRKKRKLSRWVWLGSCCPSTVGVGGTKPPGRGPHGAGGTSQRGDAGPANTLAHTSVMSVPGPRFPSVKRMRTSCPRV